MQRGVARIVGKVKLTTHAANRFYEYWEEERKITMREIKRIVARAINREMKLGIFIDRTGAMHIKIKPDLYAAVCFCDDGYLVITFHRNEKNIDINKMREKEAKSGKVSC